MFIRNLLYIQLPVETSMAFSSVNSERKEIIEIYFLVRKCIKRQLPRLLGDEDIVHPLGQPRTILALIIDAIS